MFQGCGGLLEELLSFWKVCFFGKALSESSGVFKNPKPVSLTFKKTFRQDLSGPVCCAVL